MTAEEAIDKLKESGIKFHREKTLTGALRDQNGRCPIIALAESLAPGTYDNCQWIEAANAVGISYRDALETVTVADSQREIFLEPREKELRGQLLSLCEGDGE